MSKAVRFHQLGGPEVLQVEDVELREPGEGEVLLQVVAAGLNRAEIMFVAGQYFEQPKLPSRLGYEVAGIVKKVGPGVSADLIGEHRVTIPGYSMSRYGALAEEAIVPASSLLALPMTQNAAEAAASPMQYGTAYGALVELSKIGAGDFVLITAASSSVGLAAIQIARAEGATAIATTRTSAKRPQLLELGAHHVIATAEEDLPAKVAEITGGKGCRVIFDPVGGDYVNTLAQAVAVEGRIYLYGSLSGQPTPYPMAAWPKGASLTGYSLLQMNTPERLEKMKKYIYDGIESGALKPKIDRTFKLDQAREAYEYMASNAQVGKIVIEI